MTTGWLNAISNGAFYIGFDKQVAWNTPVPPTRYHRWRDGTDANPETQYGQEREGDTSGALTTMWKTGQYWGLKVTEFARPRMLGHTLAAALRTGSDAYTAPTVNTTLAANVAAGDTVFSSVADLGNIGTLALNVDPGSASTMYEVVTVNLASRTGAGPYTYTLAAGGKFRRAHTMGVALTSISSHVFTPQAAPFEPCTYELGWGSAAFGTAQAFQLVDCVCVDVTLSGSRGQPLMVEHTWYGRLSSILATLSTPSYEGTNVAGAAGGPPRWYDGNSWKIGGSTSGNAASMRGFQLNFRNGVAWDAMQNESGTADAFFPGNYDVSGAFEVEFRSFSQFKSLYYGSSAATVGAADSMAVGYEAVDVTWATDPINSLRVNVPNLAYTAGKLTPSRQGQVLTQQLQFVAVQPAPGSAISDLVQYTLTNSRNSVY